MGYLSARQVAKKWNISQRRVQVLCSENRIEGAFKVGEVWAIPDDAPKPLDFRMKSTITEERNRVDDRSNKYRIEEKDNE